MDFWSELVKVVVSNGIFAMLFVTLFIYQLKDSAKREEEYRDTIDGLVKHLEIIEEVREEVSELKEIVTGRKEDEQV